MDGFQLFNIGFGELFFILIMVGILLGPQRIRQAARWLGQTISQLRRTWATFQQQLANELDVAERQELREALQELRDLQKEVAQLRYEVTNSPKMIQREASKAINATAPIPEPSIGGERISSPTALPRLRPIEDDPE